MSAVGQTLKQARESQGLKVHDVAETTKIRSDHIRALEDGNYGVFSAPVYIRGFVRTYAGVLKLDAKQIVDLLNKELAESGQQEPSLSQPATGVVDAVMFHMARFSRKQVLPVIVAVIVLGGTVAGYFYWAHAQKADPLAGLSPGMAEVTRAGETLPLPATR